MPAISVIVPTRQRNHLLPRCLRSLYAQTCADFEIVLVDDNPPPSRVAGDAALHGLIADARLRLIENPRPRNAAAARNCGLREARGEWITYLDDDDAYHPRKLESQLACARRAAAPLVACGVTYRLAGRSRTRNAARREFAGDELLLDFPAMPALFHRRCDVRFNEALSAAEDLYFLQALLECFRLKRFANVAGSLVDVHPQPGPRVNLNAEAVWQGNLAVYRDFAGRYSARAAEIFLVRARLLRCRGQAGEFGELAALCWRLARLHGGKDARFILGSLLFRLPLLRPLVVS